MRVPIVTVDVMPSNIIQIQNQRHNTGYVTDASQSKLDKFFFLETNIH